MPLKTMNRKTELTSTSYVINSEAQKKIYKTMARRAPTEPRDLSREWHSGMQHLRYIQPVAFKMIHDCQLTLP